MRDDPATRDEVIKAFRAYEEGGFGVTVRLGACLHAYADSWGHEGFTAWWNSSINRRTGSMRPNIGHADAADGGSAPDYPYNDVDKALEAAKAIFDKIPDKCGCPANWEDYENHLRSLFSYKNNDDNIRSEKWRSEIEKKFGEKPFFDVEYFKHRNDYFERSLGL
ncbi:DUF6765 family protein [Victivallis sp. Marseille-Q1083]|uniref:DUF6765 family protein n=1 Tax=Victivallis sp. Marseille-Q1083 TaxID=2717288 RepID=UPI00158E7A34|nr:DUF6765 family protein [Victivallis sp. Marseille-Q1083]